MNQKALLIIGLLLVGAIIVFGVSRSRGSLVPVYTPSGTEAITPQSSQAPASGNVSPTMKAALVSDITLTITTPSQGQVLKAASVAVKGKTAPGADVFVNDVETKANAGGIFSATITLDEGENYILVVANDVNGNYAEKELTVTYSP